MADSIISDNYSGHIAAADDQDAEERIRRFNSASCEAGGPVSPRSFLVLVSLQ